MTFAENVLESNRIWINDKALEEWLGAEVGKSPCCEVCGDAECRTVKVGENIHETIPADLIVKAGLIAASNMIAIESKEPCCEDNASKKNVGNISCPTCHNAHQWNPLRKEKGSNKNLEGNATNSFLRNVSYNNICIDCHGMDALFRYKYYHDPEERVEPNAERIKNMK